MACIDDIVDGRSVRSILDTVVANKKKSRRGFLTFCASATATLVLPSFAIASINRKVNLSPRDVPRPYLNSIDYIILHTTESSRHSSTGSLAKLRRNGEAHYFVDYNGDIVQLMHEDKLAKHAGRSMWNGRKNVSNYSIGIEVAGFHNQEPTQAQYTALRSLIADIQKRRGVSDKNVLSHAAVAYGTPNKWHSNNHRGRKRCGMIFSQDDVRQKLGLTDKPSYDPDVRSGRLKNADPLLAKVLYGGSKGVRYVKLKQVSKEPIVKVVSKHSVMESPVKVLVDNKITLENSAWNIANKMYDNEATIYEFPDGRKVKGSEISDFTKLPARTKVTVGVCKECSQDEEGIQYFKKGDTPFYFAGNEYASSNTIYFLTDKRVRRGDELKKAGYDFNNVPIGTGILVGYVYGGHVYRNRSAWKICKSKCKSPYTFYRIPNGELKNGDEIDPTNIPPKTLVLYKE